MTTAVKETALPDPGFPMLTRMVSSALFPNERTGKEDPTTWTVSQVHPLIPDMRVVRMFVIEHGAVEIYSVSSDGKTGMRNRIPEHRIRLIEEAMPLDVFVEELTAAESGGMDEDDEDEEENHEEPTEQETAAPSPAPNGQTSAS